VRASEREARDFLSRRSFTVLFSGGKDSLAALLWVLENVPHSNWDVLYIEVTGNTHPRCTAYVGEICAELGILDRLGVARRVDLDFFECIGRWGLPLIGKWRWCLWQFKVRVMRRRSRPVQVAGIKRSDSYRRRTAKPVEYYKQSGFVVVSPLLEWSKAKVLDYIRERGVRLNPCYALYGHSGNCMFCPYHDRKKVVLTLRDPEWREKILSALARVKRGGRLVEEKKRLWLSAAREVGMEAFIRAR